MSAEDAAIGLGCSLGDRRARLTWAVHAIGRHPAIRLIAVSRWVRTPPMRGGTARGWFLNGVLRIESTMAPHDLLMLCRDLEQRAGRRRAQHWGDRTLDVDLLLVGQQIIHDEALTLPHPAIAKRPFVRAPLLEVWPDATDPVSQVPFRDHAPATGPRAVPIGITAHQRGILQKRETEP